MEFDFLLVEPTKGKNLMFRFYLYALDVRERENEGPPKQEKTLAAPLTRASDFIWSTGQTSAPRSARISRPTKPYFTMLYRWVAFNKQMKSDGRAP